jgi:hypothetical protein
MLIAGLFGLLMAGALAGALIPVDARASEDDAMPPENDNAPEDEHEAFDYWRAPEIAPAGTATELSAELSDWDDALDDPWRDPAWTDPAIIDFDGAEPQDDATAASPRDHLSNDPWRDPTWADPSIIDYTDAPESSDGPVEEREETSEPVAPEWIGGPGETLVAQDGGGSLRGGAGDDTLFAAHAASHLQGAEGNDTLVGGAGADTLDGNDGDDRIVAGSGHALLRGGEGNDDLTGDTGDSTLQGGGGDDSLRAGTGASVLDGGHGDDVLIAGGGLGTLFGGAGDDTLIGAPEGAIALLNGGADADTLHLGRFDIAHGGSGGDVFVLGNWIGMGGAFVQDFDETEDRLVIVYDPATHPEPIVSLVPVSGQDGAAMILLDGVMLGIVQGAAELVPDDIELVTELASPSQPPARV